MGITCSIMPNYMLSTITVLATTAWDPASRGSHLANITEAEYVSILWAV